MSRGLPDSLRHVGNREALSETHFGCDFPTFSDLRSTMPLATVAAVASALQRNRYVQS
jgi:hypothetical protein